MIYFIGNGIKVTIGSRFGRVKNYSECNQRCNANHLSPFQLQDFYNYADSLNQTNFLFYQNVTNSTEDEANTTYGTYQAKTENNLQESEKLCTDVQYDFERRKWSDGKALESTEFILKWEKEFQQLWDNNKDVWPPQPYQPEFVVLNYQVLRINDKLTISIDSYGLSPAERTDEPFDHFYKCLYREDIQLGDYRDALEDCEQSNSSLQTYLNQAGCKNEFW